MNRSRWPLFRRGIAGRCAVVLAGVLLFAAPAAGQLADAGYVAGVEPDSAGQRPALISAGYTRRFDRVGGPLLRLDRWSGRWGTAFGVGTLHAPGATGAQASAVLLLDLAPQMPVATPRVQLQLGYGMVIGGGTGSATLTGMAGVSHPLHRPIGGALLLIQPAASARLILDRRDYIRGTAVGTSVRLAIVEGAGVLTGWGLHTHRRLLSGPVDAGPAWEIGLLRTAR